MRKEYSKVIESHLQKLESRTGFLQYEKIKNDPDKITTLLKELVDVAVKFEATPEQLDNIMKTAVMSANDKFIGINARWMYQVLSNWAMSNSKKGSAYKELKKPELTPEDEEKIFGKDGYFTQYLNQVKEMEDKSINTEKAKSRFDGMESVSTSYTSVRTGPSAIEDTISQMTPEELERLYEATNDPEWKELIEQELKTRKL